MHKIKFSADKSELKALESACAELGGRKAVSEFERLLAACALIGDKACEWMSREDFVNAAELVCGFEVDYARMKTAIHRSYAKRAALNVQKTNGALLDVDTRSGEKVNPRTQKPNEYLVSFRVSNAAKPILDAHREQIRVHNGK